MTLIHTIKAFKYMPLMFFGNADAVIRNEINHPVFLIQCNSHLTFIGCTLISSASAKAPIIIIAAIEIIQIVFLILIRHSL